MKKNAKGTRRAAVIARVRGTRKKHVTHKVHHRKPFRIRHLGSLALALGFLMALMLQLGYSIGSTRNNVESPKAQTNTLSTFTSVRSSNGFSFAVDRNVLGITATAVEAGNAITLDQNRLRDNKAITSVTLRPINYSVTGAQTVAQLNFRINPDTAEFNRLKQLPENVGLSDGQLAAKLYPVTNTAEFDVSVSSSTNDILDGVAVQKNVYQLVPKFGTNKTTTYAVSWTGALDDKPFSLNVLGLVGGSDIPAVFSPFFDTLNLSASRKVAGAVTSKLFSGFAASGSQSSELDSKYVSDLYSPAVVKIYHLICARVVVPGTSINTDEECTGGTGSGFIASSDGYVATNGHVVSISAKDMFVQLLASDPNVFITFLRDAGLSNAQISEIAQRPDLLAALIAEIYAAPDDAIILEGERSQTLVALGSQPVLLEKKEDIEQILSAKDSTDIRRAQVLAVDYKSSDLLAINLGDKNGFTSSDVALLKIEGDNLPVIQMISDGENVMQNQKILIMGFPGDAENQLIDNSSLGVTVTNGNISSVRDAAGGKYKLYQSDGDASQGNSGGPAINEDGEVLGLLTYRFTEGGVNAAKSYIRDINDFRKLTTDKNLTLNVSSTTQNSWLKGLEYFSQNRFTKANREFAKVKQQYPAHRLVNSYMASADKGIADGKDVKDFPIVLGIVGIVLTLAAIGAALYFILRHRGHHQVYQINQHYGTVPAPGQPYPVSVAPAQPAVQPVLGVQQPVPPQPYRQLPNQPTVQFNPGVQPVYPAQANVPQPIQQPEVITPNQQPPQQPPAVQ